MVPMAVVVVVNEVEEIDVKKKEKHALEVKDLAMCKQCLLHSSTVYLMTPLLLRYAV